MLSLARGEMIQHALLEADMAGPGLPSALKMDRYKTKLCLFHMQSRCCKGPHCPYAHGIEELRASMPPGVLNALNNRFGLGGVQGAGSEFRRFLCHASLLTIIRCAKLLGIC